MTRNALVAHRLHAYRINERNRITWRCSCGAVGTRYGSQRGARIKHRIHRQIALWALS